MRLFKLITNCVVSVLLVLSVVLNIFIFSVLGIHNGESFKQTLLAKELLTGFSSVEPETETEPTTEPVINQITTPAPETTTPAENNQITTTAPIYQDENVKITYVKKEEDHLLGPVYKFVIENTSDRPLTVSFSDVYIDGFKVTLSCLYCEDLEAGAKSVSELTLYQSEWEDFTTSPKRVEFRVRLTNPKSLLTIYETSDRITFDL